MNTPTNGQRPKNGLIAEVPAYFPANQADKMLFQFAAQQRANKKYAIHWGPNLPTLNRIAPPLFPGQICMVVACPSEGKSTFLSWWVRNIANSIKAEDARRREAGEPDDGVQNVVLYAVTEESVELARVRTWGEPVDYAAIASGDADDTALLEAQLRHANDPIVYVGQAIMSGSGPMDSPDFSGLSPRKLAQVISDLQTSMKYNVVAVAVDYLQEMVDDQGAKERKDIVTNASRGLAQVARWARVPCMVAAQANLKEVKGRDNKMPKLADIQHSSQPSQDADVVLCLWQPINDLPAGKKLEVANMPAGVIVEPNLIIAQVAKYRNVGINGRQLFLNYGVPFGDIHELAVDQMN